MEKIIQYIPQMYKALVAGVLAGIGVYGAAQAGGMTWGEWGYVIGSALGVGFGTWFKRNVPVSSVQPGPVGPQPV
jgi:hypothetical protein